MNRRPSYASVAGGSSSVPGPRQTPPTRSGAFAHLMNPTSPHTSAFDYNQEMAQGQGGSQSGAYNSRSNYWPGLAGSWGKGGTSNNYWDQHLMGSEEMNIMATGRDRLIRPSYLARTRYMEKLDAVQRTRLSSTYGNGQQTSQKPPTLSKSSSSVSLQRMAPSHRGMTYEIVENQPTSEDDTVPPLPSQWKNIEKNGGLELSPDGMDLRCSALMKTTEHEVAAARADHPMPPQCGVYYYEVSVLIKGKEGMVGVGFSGAKAELAKPPGWEPDSWAYHGDDGKSFCCQIAGKPYGATFTAGDVVGCGVNFRNSTAFFTKNGVSQGTAFKDVKSIPLYPCIGMKRAGTQVKVNFGQAPFMFDIDTYVAREMAIVSNEINKTDVSTLSPSLSESALAKELVAQFLRHNGYVDTAKAFSQETKIEAKALDKNFDDIASELDLQQDIDAVNRQHIRTCILEGDISTAFKRTTAFYPHVLEDNPQIKFNLRCRKFVEMMRLCAESLEGSSKPKATNGHSSNLDGFSPDMEIDEPVQVGDTWDRMDVDRAAASAEHIQDALRYGKELQQDYKDDVTKEQTLKDIFALFAYEDPRNTPAASLLDPSGRVPVAEELNSAILVSLGKSSSAAVERVYQQADVLIAEITEQGAPGAFVNLDSEAR